jgi:hypothetical protein
MSELRGVPGEGRQRFVGSLCTFATDSIAAVYERGQGALSMAFHAVMKAFTESARKGSRGSAPWLRKNILGK